MVSLTIMFTRKITRTKVLMLKNSLSFVIDYSGRNLKLEAIHFSVVSSFISRRGHYSDGVE